MLFLFGKYLDLERTYSSWLKVFPNGTRQWLWLKFFSLKYKLVWRKNPGWEIAIFSVFTYLSSFCMVNALHHVEKFAECTARTSFFLALIHLQTYSKWTQSFQERDKNRYVCHFQESSLIITCIASLDNVIKHKITKLAAQKCSLRCTHL